MKTRLCRKCKKEFTPESHREKYCSTDCSPCKTRIGSVCRICGDKVTSGCSYCETHRNAAAKPKVYYADAHRRAAVNWQKTHPEKVRAQYLAKYHVSALTIFYECPCDGEKENHHFDYSRPLDVIRLCASCHRLEHRRLDSLQSTSKSQEAR